MLIESVLAFEVGAAARRIFSSAIWGGTDHSGMSESPGAELGPERQAFLEAQRQQGKVAGGCWQGRLLRPV